MIPSEKYAVDYTDGNGLKWSKQLNQIYTSLGNIDMSAAISSYNNPIAKNVYRKSRTYNPLYDNSITYASVGHDSLVMKYFERNAYPTDEITSGTAIVNFSSPDGQSYVTGVNEDASSPYNGGMATARILTDTEYNKMLFKVTLREMTLNASDVPIPNSSYTDPTYTDIQLKDINENKWYGLYYHNGAKVWNGSTWVDANMSPVLMCNGDSVQSFQGGGSSFNNLFNNYNGTMGSGQNIEFTNAASNYYWTAHNFVNRMNIENYSLGWSDTYNYKPSFADNFDAMKTFMLNYLTDNNYSPWQSAWFQLCREVHIISDDMAVLLTVFCYACLDGNNNLYINFDNTYTFPMIKGSSVSKFLAGHGLYYLTDDTADLSEITPDTLHNSSAIWVGEMSADGTTTGNWIKGADIENYAGYNKDGNINNPNFNPSGGGGGDADDVEKDMNTVTATGNAGMVTYYEINKQGTATATQISDAISKFDITAIGKDLIRNLISYKAFAVLPVASHLLNIIHISGKDLKDSSDNDLWGDTILSMSKISIGTVKVNAMYGDFRDYAPYTKVEMYIPFCGWFPLPSWVIGKTLSGDMWVDLYNGTVKAIVKASSTVVAEVGGCCAYDIPFVAESTGTKAGAVISSALATAGMTAATIATPNIATSTAAISSAANLASALNANNTTLKGCLGDGSNVNGLNKIWVKITRPSRLDGKKEIPDAYKHEYGIPCGKQLTLTAGDGYTQIMDANITGAMTDREKQMIIDGFKHGLIL